MTKYQHFSKCDHNFSESRYEGISAEKLYQAVKLQGRKKFKYYLNQAYVGHSDNSYWSMKHMADTYVRMKNVDKNIPIILTPQGWVCDGQHRVARAIADGDEYIWAYRLLKMPDKDE